MRYRLLSAVFRNGDEIEPFVKTGFDVQCVKDSFDVLDEIESLDSFSITDKFASSATSGASQSGREESEAERAVARIGNDLFPSVTTTI